MKVFDGINIAERKTDILPFTLTNVGRLAKILDTSVDEIFESNAASSVHIDTRNSVFHDNSGFRFA